jgi:hypothetical protein
MLLRRCEELSEVVHFQDLAFCERAVCWWPLARHILATTSGCANKFWRPWVLSTASGHELHVKL